MNCYSFYYKLFKTLGAYMRNISFLFFLPLTLFATQELQDASFVETSYIQSQEELDSSPPIEEASITYIEKRLPLPSDPDIIIPSAFQDNPSYIKSEEPTTPVVIEAVQTDPQSIAAERVIRGLSSSSEMVVQPKEVIQYTTVQTQIIPPKTAQPIEDIKDIEIPQIQGTYILDKGVERNTNIDKAMMIIEKLDDDDFGYYYVRRIGEHPSTGYLGIFHYNRYKKRFVNKVKEDDVNTKELENIEIKFDGLQLETIQDIAYGQRAIIWNKVDENCQADPSLVKSLSDIKESYRQIYKNNKNFLVD